MATVQRPHTAFQALPLVDIAPLFSNCSEERLRGAHVMGNAAREAGFFYVSGHGVDRQLIDRLKARTAEFFALPLASKLRFYIGNSSNHSGYVPEGEEEFASATVDHKEAYDLGFELDDPAFSRPMLGANQWPDLPGFREDIKAYYDAVLDLSRVLFKGFALALGLPEETFLAHVNRPPSQLRLVHYPFNPDVPEDRPGIGAHTDYECFTILLPTAPGLEVLNGAGEWIDVPLVDEAFVINIGDMMEVLSNGTWVATSHRVRKVAEERYAFPLFCACDYDAVIAPVPALVDPVAPSRYAPLVCGEHLFAQTAQTFGYLKRRLETGELVLPEGAKALSSFGYDALRQEVRV